MTFVLIPSGPPQRFESPFIIVKTTFMGPNLPRDEQDEEIDAVMAARMNEKKIREKRSQLRLHDRRWH
jgi:hypothetical protein